MKQVIADHSARCEQLWARIGKGDLLQSPEDIGGALGVASSTVRDWIKRNEVAFVRIGGRLYSTLEAVVESLRANSRAQDAERARKAAVGNQKQMELTERRLAHQERMRALGLDKISLGRG
jgi:hypothetical protein